MSLRSSAEPMLTFTQLSNRQARHNCRIDRHGFIEHQFHHSLVTRGREYSPKENYPFPSWNEYKDPKHNTVGVLRRHHVPLEGEVDSVTKILVKEVKFLGVTRYDDSSQSNVSWHRFLHRGGSARMRHVDPEVQIGRGSRKWSLEAASEFQKICRHYQPCSMPPSAPP